MAWRPTRYLLEGELDNTRPGRVTGWMRFTGMARKVTFDLKGDFHRDIRGTKIHFTGDGWPEDPTAASYMDGMTVHQEGKVGDITAGLEPQDYVDYPYIEWYGQINGRAVIELKADQLKVIGQPIPTTELPPLSRDEQARNMSQFLLEIAQELHLPTDRAICVDMEHRQIIKSGRHPVELLTEGIRRQLPPLYGQDGKGGEAIAYVRFFTPDGSWTWYATEFDPAEGRFFGLVDGQFRELGYFLLWELETTTGPMGLHIERDLHWKPTRLRDIAPELFEKDRSQGAR